MKNKFKSSLPIIPLLLTMLLSLYMLANSKQKIHSFMCILPLMYSIMVLISGAYKRFFSPSSPGWTIVNLLYVFKAIIYPVGVIIVNVNFAFSESVVINAILLEAGEIFVIYGIYALYTRFKKPVASTAISPVQNDYKHGKFLMVAFLCLTLSIILIFPSSLNTYEFINSSNIGQETSSTSNIVSIIIDYGRIILLIVALNFFYKKYREGKNVYFVWSIVFVCFTAVIIKGVSRTSYVIPALCGLFLLLKLYPNKKKQIILSVGGVLSLGFIVASFIRFNLLSLSELMNLDSFQAYFCCTKNMAASIEARKVYADSINIHTFFSDLFGNWMGIGHAFRKYENISEYFNYAFYGHRYSVDQVVPTIGEALIQFGYIGTYIYTIIMCMVILKFDDKFNGCNKIEFTYLYVFTSIKCAITLMGNLKIFMATVLNYLIPLYFFFWLNSKMLMRNSSMIKRNLKYDQFTKDRI